MRRQEKCKYGKTQDSCEVTCIIKLNSEKNKANLRDLIVVTGLVILLKSNPNPLNRLFSAYVTLTFDRWPCKTIENILCSQACVSFHSHLWIQMRIIVQKYSNRSQIGYFSARVTLKFDVPSKTNRAPFHCPFKLCALFRSHMCIQTQVTVWRCSIRVKIVDYSAHVAWN